MLHVHHCSPHAPELANTLAEFHFGQPTQDRGAPHQFPVPLAPLGAGALIERWSTDAPVSCGVFRDFTFTHDDQYLFASLVVDSERSDEVEQVTRSTYLHMDHLVRHLGYPHWLRAWNYLRDITAGEGEQERYRRFNVGRFGAVGLRSSDQNLPAASALGSDTGGLIIACLAGRQPGEQIENPRQVSAIRYPPRYGLRSPMFARATLIPHGQGARLLVSGTASIVGHESLHAGDTGLQLEETARNFDALVEAAMQAAPGRSRTTSARLETLRVYLRNPQDYQLLLPRVRQLFRVETEPLFLKADICRPELLIEAEGTYCLE